MQILKIVGIVFFACSILGATAPAATGDGSSGYAERCAACHGPDGRADTPVGRALGIGSFEGRTFTVEGVGKLLREIQSHASIDRTSIENDLPSIVEKMNALAARAE